MSIVQKLHHRTAPLLFVALGLAAGCSDRGLVAQSPGYLASDKCIQSADQASCGAQIGCQWLQIPVAEGNNSASEAPRAMFACVAQDVCLSLGQTACLADSGCAWSKIGTLCPVGSDCSSGGFCHAKDNGGGDCACVSPIACPLDGECAKVECDCSGGGGGSGGGACGCSCAPCAPGAECPPCACNCEGGGGGGNSGCDQPGTCACACPACAPGEDCPPCDCTCGSGGGTTINDGSPDPCSKFTDATSCEASESFQCGVAPSPAGVFVCASVGTKPGTPPSCACACPVCPDGAPCAPCACDCGTDGGIGGGNDGGTSSGGLMTGCIPPAPPPSRPGPPSTDKPTPIACPAIGCAASCANGTLTGSDGCPTCACR